MLSFLKTCGRGCLVVISSPLWLALFALYIVYGIGLFFYMLVKGLVKLFTKNKLTLETSYDKKAKAILSNPSFNPMTGVVAPQAAPMGVPPTPAPQPVQPQQYYQPQQQPPYSPYPPNYPPPQQYQQPPYPPQNPNGYPPQNPYGNNGYNNNNNGEEN